MKKFIDIINEAQDLDENQRSWMSAPEDVKGEDRGQYEIGALHRSQFRGVLERAKIEGKLRDFQEDKGLITSMFTVYAPSVTVRALNNWCKRFDEE